ncbi:hypothetical protein VNI00_017825 [Paramarasmius palmivorus]|uniref:Uncharacterized protein n=1 Tax=Paramarasmius palmivorus TaxID=297713 RepID=A0AAW0B2S0_9AGAR
MPPDNPLRQYRQPRQLTTSSSFNWWPYPPWGASTSTTPAAVTITTTIQEVQSSDPEHSPSVAALPTPTTLSQGSIHIPTNSSSISPSSPPPVTSSASSLSGSNTVISITPLEASPNATPSFIEYPKNSSNTNTNEKINMILIPVFVVVGVVLGSIVAWFAYGCITRKAHRKKGGRRRTELEVGPEYAYSPSFKEDPEKISLPTADQHGVEQEPTWKELGHIEEQNFLLVPTAPNTFLSPGPRDSSNKSLSRATTSKTATSVSVYSQIDLEDNEEDYDPRSPRIGTQKKRRDKGSLNTVRRVPTTATTATSRTTSTSKSSRVESLSRRRPTYSRDDTSSSSHAELSRNTTATTTTTATRKGTGDTRRPDLSRTTTSRTTTTTRTGAGFRIVDESPLQSPTDAFASPNTGFSWAGVGEMIWQRRAPDLAEQDKYTSLPKPPARSKKSGNSRKNIVEERDRRLREYYGYDLPRSPPQVTTPRLEGELCFTPLIGQGKGL